MYIEEVSRELYEYMPEQTKRRDFDEFWKATLEKGRAVPLRTEITPYEYPSDFVKVYQIAYNGFDETRIHGWLIVPEFIKREKYPCIIHYHGFNGSRGRPADFMHWITMGAAVISVDCREQLGDTGNAAVYSSGTTQSVVCKGVLDKEEYYFRSVYVDCLKAIDFACTLDCIDETRIIIEGGSQGGALGMAVCSLDQRPYAMMVDVPSNSNIEKRVEGANGSFSAVTDYLKRFPDRVDRVFETLSYFDTMNMAERIQCPVLASVALKDNVCPAKMYFASYNRIQSKKDIKIYPFNGHEGGGALHMEEKLRFLKSLISG